MKTLVIYDSLYGNTEKVARVVADTLNTKAIRVGDVQESDLHKINIFVIGSPVHGGRPTPEIELFIKNLPDKTLRNVKTAAFDTRFAPEDHGIGIKILIRVIKFAAERMAAALVKKGGKLVVKPQGFIVNDKRGPLKAGELERAIAWAKEIKSYENYK